MDKMNPYCFNKKTFYIAYMENLEFNTRK